MAEVTGFGIIETYNSLVGNLPQVFQTSINLLILVALVSIYTILIWKFYKFISRKNFLGLNLNKYNQYQHSIGAKLLTSFLYFIEYIIVLPFLVFIWFAVFTLLLITLTTTENVSQILVIAAVVIAATRVIAYYKEEPADELAKFLPLTLLAISILNPNTFVESQYLERIISNLAQIPSFFGQIVHYWIFIILLEIILRFFDFIFSFFGLEEVVEE